MIETSNLHPAIGRSAAYEGNSQKTEGNSIKKFPSVSRVFSTLSDWLVAGGPHVLLADISPHVGPICLPTAWKHVSVSEAGVICHA